jgi:hypothetical protein
MFSLANCSIKAQNKIWVRIYRGGDVKVQSLIVIPGILQEFFFDRICLETKYFEFRSPVVLSVAQLIYEFM